MKNKKPPQRKKPTSMADLYARRPWVAWYKTKEWYRLRHWRLAQDKGLCRFCKQQGKIQEANTVDHIIPHRGNMKLFFDRNNTQALCQHCHNSVKQRIEKSGEFGCDVNGFVAGWIDG